MPEDLKDALVNTHYVVEYYALPYPGPISIGCRIQHEVDYALPAGNFSTPRSKSWHRR